METIVLTEKQFKDLPEYSCSIPTGTTIGKQWKHNRFAFDPAARDPRTGNTIEEWYLHEYTEHKDPGKVGISTKMIVGILKLKSKKNDRTRNAQEDHHCLRCNESSKG